MQTTILTRALLGRTLLAGGLALALVACTKAEAPVEAAATPEAAAPAADDKVAQVASVGGPQVVEGTIDWAAARDARSKSAITDSPITVASAETPPAVPVLLPSGIVTPQNAAPPKLVTTEDGYFATYKTLKYDAIVNGTKKSYAAGAAPAGDKTAMKFTTGEASAQLAFSRFGADYLIEFECKEVDGADSCITEDEAKVFGESLFVARTQ